MEYNGVPLDRFLFRALNLVHILCFENSQVFALVIQDRVWTFYGGFRASLSFYGENMGRKSLKGNKPIYYTVFPQK